MKILDSQGRLFGKLSILDVGAVLIILLVVVGIFFFPGTSGSVAQVGGVTTKPIQIDVIALGLKGRDLQSLFKVGDKVNMIIRNQPYGQVDIKAVKTLTRTVAVPQPNGTVKALPDPREEESFSRNMMFTLQGKGQITKDGPVFGNLKIKIGNTVELEGFNYNFNASVIDVRIQK
ncbi:pyruvate/2-oxoglutarate dehydrogenase complex,dihydrolipoamide dehydrogenase (E3) component [Oscillatoriales cyanobacterium USR001]|nr:pyruvate/2-oxoglutarate dehydrogenase complex,dihydrolipoamide dehydrogenase (E3) component [Oscillatoriales cyanobacterium USR001]